MELKMNFYSVIINTYNAGRETGGGNCGLKTSLIVVGIVFWADVTIGTVCTLLLFVIIVGDFFIFAVGLELMVFKVIFGIVVWCWWGCGCWSWCCWDTFDAEDTTTAGRVWWYFWLLKLLFVVIMFDDDDVGNVVDCDVICWYLLFM